MQWYRRERPNDTRIGGSDYCLQERPFATHKRTLANIDDIVAGKET